jgi:hypothetical protein
MRAPSHRGSIDKRVKDHAAKEARRRLHYLFIDVAAWTDTGVNTNYPQSKHGHTLAFLEFFANDNALDAHPLAGILRSAALPVLRQSRPPIGQHGHYGDLNASRDQTIRETVAALRERFGLPKRQASAIVSETLKSLVYEYRRTYLRLKKREGADKTWLDECQKRVVDTLNLSADRIEAIAKKS